MPPTEAERGARFVQFYVQFRLPCYVRKIFNQLTVVESLMAGSLRNCACHYITTKTNYQTENPDLFLIACSVFSIYQPEWLSARSIWFTGDPWTAWVWIARVHLHSGFFLLNAALHHSTTQSRRAELANREGPCICTVGTYGGPTRGYTQILQRVGPPHIVEGPNCTLIGLFNDFPLNLGKNPNSLIWCNKPWHLPTECREYSACHHLTNRNLTHLHMTAKGTPDPV